MKIEEILLQEDLKWYNADYKFVHCDKDRLSRISEHRRNHYWIPVGTLDFVQEALRVFYGVEKINPIEIPKCLRKPAFLGRNYYFVQKENLPKSGVYFIKHVEEAKGFSYSGDINEIYNFTKELPDGLYQVSDFVPDIISEWRAYISRNKILSIFSNSQKNAKKEQWYFFPLFVFLSSKTTPTRLITIIVSYIHSRYCWSSILIIIILASASIICLC